LSRYFLAGSTIARATLHNADEVKRKDIRIGDIVLIEKGGDVIPKVVSADISQRKQTSQVWQMPENCPSCGQKVTQLAGEVATRCLNSELCPEQHLRGLIYFVSKPSMDIEHLGEKVVEQLVRKEFVKKPSDFFKLREEQLYQLDGFKAKSVQNLMQSIEKSKEVVLSRFIMALGIKHIGIGTAELLAFRAGTIEALMQMSKEELLRIDGVGDKVADAVVDYFANASNQEEIAALLAAGVHPIAQQVISFGEHAFNEKIFVLTGSLKNYTRQGAAGLIKERGGKVTDSVSKKTNYVLAGEAAGSKLDKAVALGITILTEEEFNALL